MTRSGREDGCFLHIMGSYSVTERRADLKLRTERADSEVSKLKKEKIKNRQVSGRYVTLNVFTGGSKG